MNNSIKKGYIYFVELPNNSICNSLNKQTETNGLKATCANKNNR